ncbi:magnesium transporter, putative [Plasmodium ovale wallikeri]|uniref:Magnesium transporter, putative n=1 Tax=Plasmodium ovale wallikeri TaxID=864142 RepID=A0A1A8YUJ6_PLAOA|nr:magnesium transporter, putative [Plasmodium ovale wallikeri]
MTPRRAVSTYALISLERKKKKKKKKERIMFQWKQVNICRRRITRTHLPLLWLSQFTTIKNENKIFSKKNFNNVLMQNIRISEDGRIACEKVFFSKYNLPYVLSKRKECD